MDVTRIDIAPNPAPMGAELSLEVREKRDGPFASQLSKKKQNKRNKSRLN